MKTLYIYLLTIIFSITVSAQEFCSIELINSIIEDSKSAIITAELFVNEHPTKKEQFYNNWTNGSIKFTNGTEAYNCKLRYNAWLDELIWLRESDFKSGLVLKSTIQEFTFNNNDNTNIKFTKYKTSNGINTFDTFLEAISEGKIALLCHRKASYNKNAQSFSNKQQFYLYRNGKLTKLCLNKRSLKSILSENELIQLKQILKENNLSIKNEYELARAFELLVSK